MCFNVIVCNVKTGIVHGCLLGCSIKFYVYALANDDGDMKSGLLAKLKGFSLIVQGEMLHWLYTSSCNGGAAHVVNKCLLVIAISDHF